MHFIPVVSLLLCLLWVRPGHTEPVRIVTTDFPPYSYRENGEVKGVATEVVLELFRRANVDHEPIAVFPWARAYHAALSTPNTLIYSIARSDERIRKFHWIGTIAPYHVQLYKLKSRNDIVVNTLEDAKRYRIGGEYEDIKQAWLQKQGFVVGKHIILAANSEINLKKLIAGRIDLLPFDEAGLPERLRKLGYHISMVQPTLLLSGVSHPLYLAANRDTDAQIVQRLQKTFNELVEEDFMTTIYNEYLTGKPQREFPILLRYS